MTASQYRINLGSCVLKTTVKQEQNNFVVHNYTRCSNIMYLNKISLTDDNQVR